MEGGGGEESERERRRGGRPRERTAASEQSALPEGLRWPGRAERSATGWEPRAWPAASEDETRAIASPSQQAELPWASSWQRPRTFGALYHPGQI